MEKKQNSPQPDERSDRAKKSPIARREIRQSFLQAPPQEKQNKPQIPTERNLHLPWPEDRKRSKIRRSDA